MINSPFLAAYATYAKTYAKWNNRNKRNGLSSTEIVSLWLLTDVGFMVEFWQFFVTIQNDKNLYTCTKEILKYRIAGLRMKKV